MLDCWFDYWLVPTLQHTKFEYTSVLFCTGDTHSPKHLISTSLLRLSSCFLCVLQSCFIQGLLVWHCDICIVFLNYLTAQIMFIN